jgi:hypothetical protein
MKISGYDPVALGAHATGRQDWDRFDGWFGGGWSQKYKINQTLTLVERKFLCNIDTTS